MLKNHVISALRNLLKNKVFSAINILGLSIGIASFMIIFTYVYHEFSYDRYHKNAARIYRIVEDLRTENELLLQSTSSPPMGPMLAHEFSEVERFVRFGKQTALVKTGDHSFYEDESLLADSSVFDVFSFHLMKGDSKTALTEPNTVILTESLAKKYFGDADPFGQLLQINNEPMKVTGVMADVPKNSHFHFNLLISFSTWSSKNKDTEMQAWMKSNVQKT